MGLPWPLLPSPGSGDPHKDADPRWVDQELEKEGQNATQKLTEAIVPLFLLHGWGNQGTDLPKAMQGKRKDR